MSTSFADLGVPDDLVTLLASRGIDEPFPIQAATIADALAGHDLCGRAPTGSGKTLAFGIPLVLKTGKPQSRRPRALVLVPTRELADQVARELVPLARSRGRFVMSAYGGTGYGSQVSELRRGVSILVACPGRLEDLIERGDCDLSDVQIVVLDEADRMADMGFMPAVKRIMDKTSEDRQTLLFSATLDGEVDALVKRYQHDPKRHEVTVEETEQGIVDHHLWSVRREDRVELTARLVTRHWPAIVFCRTKHGADRLTKQLGGYGVAAIAIHGNRSQPQRERALAAFTAGKVQALVATDVAARGIHVDEVRLVVHFDPPADEKDYTHRSGRTGRAGHDGLVVTMVLPETLKDVRKMARAAGLSNDVERSDPSLLGELTGKPIVPIRTSSDENPSSRARPPRHGGGGGRGPKAAAGSGGARRGSGGGGGGGRRSGGGPGGSSGGGGGRSAGGRGGGRGGGGRG